MGERPRKTFVNEKLESTSISSISPELKNELFDLLDAKERLRITFENNQKEAVASKDEIKKDSDWAKEHSGETKYSSAVKGAKKRISATEKRLSGELKDAYLSAKPLDEITEEINEKIKEIEVAYPEIKYKSQKDWYEELKAERSEEYMNREEKAE